jgi:hypothetical protein
VQAGPAQAASSLGSDDKAMEQSDGNDRRAVEERGGNRDALIEGNIVADERQLDPAADVNGHETGSERAMQASGESAVTDPSGAYGTDRDPAADATLKDGSIPADADLDMPSDAMNSPEQLDEQ